MGVRKMVIENDCLRLLNALKSGSTRVSTFHLLVEDIVSLVN